MAVTVAHARLQSQELCVHLCGSACLKYPTQANPIIKNQSNPEWHARCRFKEKDKREKLCCLWVSMQKTRIGMPYKSSSQTDTVLKAWEKIHSPGPIQQACDESRQLGQTTLSGVTHNHWHMGIQNTWMGTQQASLGKGLHPAWAIYTWVKPLHRTIFCTQLWEHVNAYVFGFIACLFCLSSLHYVSGLVL